MGAHYFCLFKLIGVNVSISIWVVSNFFNIFLINIIMANDPQVLKTAKKMIARYGDDACRQVEERIVELSQSAEDYSDACETWQQVHVAITAMLESSSHISKN